MKCPLKFMTEEHEDLDLDHNWTHECEMDDCGWWNVEGNCSIVDIAASLSLISHHFVIKEKELKE